MTTDDAGMEDPDIFDWAVREGRVILTFDKDFGRIAQRVPSPAECGVILFRFVLQSASDAEHLLVNIICERSDWPGHFSVVEPGRIRVKPMAEIGR